MLKKALLHSFLACSIFAPLAEASNWYWGAGGGAGKIRDLCEIETGYDCDDAGFIIRGLGGYELNRFVSFEAALDIGVGFNSPYIYPESRNDDTNLSYSLLQIQTVFFIPVAKQVSLITGLGACISNVTYEEKNTISRYDNSSSRQQKNSGNQAVAWDWDDDDYGDDDDYNDDDNDDKGGSSAEFCDSGLMGVQLALTEKSSLRIQNQYYFAVDGDAGFHGKKDINAFTVNFIRKF